MSIKVCTFKPEKPDILVSEVLAMNANDAWECASIWASHGYLCEIWEDQQTPAGTGSFLVALVYPKE